MFCAKCGNEVEQQARFCSKCGSDLAPVQTVQKSPHDMNMHINILGWLFVGTAILFGLLGMLMFFAGQIVQRLPIPIQPDFPFDVAHFAGSLAGLIGLAVIAVACGVAAAGIGLLQYRSWGRVLAIIMSFLLIFKFPVGTAIAIYAFWVLFSDEGRRYYENRSAAANA